MKGVFCTVNYTLLIAGYVLLEPPFDAFVNGRGNDVPVLLGK